MSKFRQLIQKIETLKGAPLVGLQGVSEEEIKELTQRLDCSLPDSYVDFLRVCGNSLRDLEVYDDFFWSYDFDFKNIFFKKNIMLSIASGEDGISEMDICLLINKNLSYIDPPVYFMHYEQPESHLRPDNLEALHFSSWMASNLVKAILLNIQECKFTLSPNVWDGHMEFSEKINLDQLIYNLFIKLGFVSFLEGVTETVFMQGTHTYLIYYPALYTGLFKIYVGTNQKDLKDTLAKQLGRLLHNEIDIENGI